MFKTITGKKIYNLTGSPIRMVARNGRTIVIDADGFAPSTRGGDWKTMILDGGVASINCYDVSGGHDYYDADPIEDFIPDSDNGDWFAIVTDEYYMACLAMEFPTDRIYTVGRPLLNADGTIRGTSCLVKR